MTWQDVSLYQMAPDCQGLLYEADVLDFIVRTNKNLERILSRAVDLMWVNFSKGHPLYCKGNWLWREAKKLREYTGGRFNSTGPEKFINWKHSLVAQTVKNLPAMRETRVQSLCWEDPMEKGMATHSGILSWRILWQRSWQATVHGVTKSRTRLSNFYFQCS